MGFSVFDAWEGKAGIEPVIIWSEADRSALAPRPPGLYWASWTIQKLKMPSKIITELKGNLHWLYKRTGTSESDVTQRKRVTFNSVTSINFFNCCSKTQNNLGWFCKKKKKQALKHTFPTSFSLIHLTSEESFAPNIFWVNREIFYRFVYLTVIFSILHLGHLIQQNMHKTWFKPNHNEH